MMKHPLEIENEELRNRIEDTYEQISKVQLEITQYKMMEMVTSIHNQTSVNMSSFAMYKEFMGNKDWGTK